MKSFTRINALWLCAVVLSFIGLSAINTVGQPVYQRPTTTASPTPKPFLQDIQVQPANTNTENSSTTLVTKTASVSPAYPVINEVEIPGYSGILVETLDGKSVVDSYSNYAFNPASNVKIATSYAVLKTFGPDFRFQTTVWTEGQIDPTTRTLNGNLYVSGRDPMFNLEHAVNVAYELNRLGISTVTGDLIVTDNFALNYNMSPVSSGNGLAAAMDSMKRNAATAKAWQNYLVNSGKYGKITLIPSVTVSGSVYVQPIPNNLRQLFTHESAPLREIIKVTMCYSNNFLSERLGDMIGGPFRVAQMSQQAAGVSPQEFVLQTSSGLGINIDKGTLEGRFDTDFARGSVVGKTGTLGRTDGGVSALAGEISTRSGKLLFVIFNQKGSVPRFRTFQNNYVSLIQGQFGGAAQMPYNPVALDVRLANTRITYPNLRARIN
jgi:D-alanyl-D-alanine carboxypeptidase